MPFQTVRSTLCAAVLLSTVVFLPAPALATYCGPTTSAAMIEQLTIHTFNTLPGRAPRHIDRTSIMFVVVSGDYADSVVEYAGENFLFFQRSNGRWRYISGFPPSTWPASVKNKLAALENEWSEGSEQCSNPHFISRGSG